MSSLLEFLGPIADLPTPLLESVVWVGRSRTSVRTILCTLAHAIVADPIRAPQFLTFDDDASPSQADLSAREADAGDDDAADVRAQPLRAESEPMLRPDADGGEHIWRIGDVAHVVELRHSDERPPEIVAAFLKPIDAENALDDLVRFRNPRDCDLPLLKVTTGTVSAVNTLENRPTALDSFLII